MTDETLLPMKTTKGEDSTITYSKKEIDLIQNIYAKGATQDEFRLMIHLSKEYGLNILQKHIWLIKFGKAPAVIFVGRDGFLDIAQRSGQFDGFTTEVTKVNEPISKAYQETVWVDGRSSKVNKKFESPFQFYATCTVYRKDTKHPIVVTVYEEEYTTGRDNWATKRRTMIGKVSESQALRKAFSVSGVYAPEEIDVETMPMTPEYEVGPDFPKRSEMNKKLNPDNCKTIDEFNEIKDSFIKEFGHEALNMASGHKTERWMHLFGQHECRLLGVNPIDTTKGPEELQKEFDGGANSCETQEIYDELHKLWTMNPCLDTKENAETLDELQKKLEFLA